MFIFFIRGVIEILMLPLLLIISCVPRVLNRPIDVGLGPEPLLNNIYHKRALEKFGYSAETFVTSLYFITQSFDKPFVFNNRLARLFAPYFVYLFSIFRYKALYIYFNGGALYSTALLWRAEPYFYRLANVKIMVMPYGSDVQCLDRCPNLLFRHVMARDYPTHRFRQSVIKKRIDLWSKHSDHIIGGCDWVDYLYYWDTLLLAHFSIDTEVWSDIPSDIQPPPLDVNKPLRVLHAPNHRELKGTQHFIRAVEELNSEGLKIELVLAEKLPNDEVRKLMRSVDVVADQLIIGWYAMFALEAMSLGKPVLCYLRDDLKQLYVDAGLVKHNEIPIINCSPSTVKSTLRRLAESRQELQSIGRQGHIFVEKHHSLGAIGTVFDGINRSIGLIPIQDAKRGS